MTADLNLELESVSVSGGYRVVGRPEPMRSLRPDIVRRSALGVPSSVADSGTPDDTGVRGTWLLAVMVIGGSAL